MNVLRPLWIVAASLALVACGGGGPESPDFQGEVIVKSLVIHDAQGQPVDTVSMPAGTVQNFDAIATVHRTVPPGTPGAQRDDQGRLYVEETHKVTSAAAWSSSNPSVATVDTGLVEAKQVGTGTLIGAAYEGHTDTLLVDVTDAVLTGIVDVRREGGPTDPNDTYRSMLNAIVPFEMIGRFSDGSERVLAPDAPNVHEWRSSDHSVASKLGATDDLPLNQFQFQTRSVGETTINGLVAQPNTLTPDHANALLKVAPIYEFCQSLFGTDAAVTVDQTPECSTCTAEGDLNHVKDGILSTFVKLNVPLGLAAKSAIWITVANPVGSTPIAPGQPAGFVISRPAPTLAAAELLSNITVTTLKYEGGTLVPTNDPGTLEELRLSWAGDTDAGQTALVSTPPTTVPFDALRLTFNASIVALLTSLHVHEACPTAVP